jgi:Holliday junction resolvase RusA-like endonuclease
LGAGSATSATDFRAGFGRAACDNATVNHGHQLTPTITFDFFVPGEPVQQGSMRSFLHKATGRVIMIHDKPELKTWRKQVAVTCADKMRQMQVDMAGKQTAVGLQVRFLLARCKAAAKRSLPIVEIDLDKAVRAIGDALTGVAYVDDKQICRIEADKVYAEAPGPGVEVRVIWLDAIL